MRARGAVLLAAVAGVGLTAACARQGAPPGGPPDRRPPVVVATVPDTYAVLEDFSGPVRFVFDERVSERVTGGELDGAVLVSPRTGEVEVEHARGALEVGLAGGFEEDRVYRVTLLPVVSDLFGNQMRDPFELVFSTGAELNASALAGQAWDRVTGQGVEGLRVLAMDTRDSTTYAARSDSGGIYAFRYLPRGPYRLLAFQDRDADEEVDEMEPQGVRFIQIQGPDTIFNEIGVLQPDTSPAVLTGAEVVDSVTLALRFDDHLDPGSRLQPGNVGLDAVATDSAGEVVGAGPDEELQLAEGVEAPGVAAVFHVPAYRRHVAEVADSLARLDSLDQVRAREARAAGDTARADSLAGLGPRRPPTPVGGGAGGAGEDERLGPDGRPLPAQRIVVVLDTALVVNRAYRVVATGVENIAGIPLGGGEAVVVRTPPPAPDTAAADSLAAPPDSAGTPPDSAGTPPDGAAPADSIPGAEPGAAPDTAAPPDTLPPDTASAPDTLAPFRPGPGPLR